MKFSEALQQAIDTGVGIYRPSWNGNQNREAEGVKQFVTLFAPEAQSNGVTLMPLLVIHQPNNNGNLVSWVPSQGDLFAQDWATL